MNAKINITYRDKNNMIITDPKDGEMSYSPETQKLYKWSAAAGEWKMIEGDINIGMTSYDLNKQIISQMGILDEVALAKAFNDLDEYAANSDATYFMLLCRDINYYTIFKVNREEEISDTLETFSAEVIDCVLDVGAIKSVESVPGDAFEIWAHPVDGDPVAMYLFPYDVGVIECTL